MMKKQRGLTLISWAVIIGLAGIQLVFAMRIIPVYMDYSTVKSIMDNVKTKEEFRSKTPREILTYIQKTMSLNYLNELSKKKDAFKFKQRTDGLQLNLHYEDRGPIFGNLEFVATFEYEIVIPRSKHFSE